MYYTTRANVILTACLAALLGFGVGALAASNTVGQANGSSHYKSAPDWTLAPCALWATEVAPVLPPFTIETACVTEDGLVSVAPGQLATK